MRNLLLVVLVAFSFNSIAEEASQCHRPDEPKIIESVMPNGQVANQVLCCCSTGNGGQCCKYVSMCTGSYIPGCWCSGHSIDAEPDAIQLNDSKING